MPLNENQNGENFPRVYLAIDNCFASKRWTEPDEWGEIVSQLGLLHVEASADNEIDPLYSTPDYLETWRRKAMELREQTGVRVSNLYSGHGTYATLGLSHLDTSVRQHIQDDWLRQMILSASQANAGLGFFCHAFSQKVLQHPPLYREMLENLYASLSELAAFAAEHGVTLGLEQMYTPHQVPWTIDGAAELMKQIYRRSGAPLYITIDTGHQSGQRKFLRPNRQTLQQALRSGARASDIWLGPESAYALVESSTGKSDTIEERTDAIEKEIDRFDYMFAAYEDGDPYAWLRRLGAYSPIIHLQQTDGRSSSHRPFTAAHNKTGIIEAEKVLRAIVESFLATPDPDMPPRCDDIYLTLEIFSATADYPQDIVDRLRESVQYWRRFIPEDGVPLNQIPCIQHACVKQERSQ